MKSISLKMLLMFCAAWSCFYSPSADAGLEVVRLSDRLKKLQNREEIQKMFKEMEASPLVKSPPVAVDLLWRRNSGLVESIQKDFLQSTSFVRGEIEDPAVMNSLIEVLQLSLLQSRRFAAQGKWADVLLTFRAWFLFAADFSYEESSLIGLRFVGVVRSLLLDEWERMHRSFERTQQTEEEILRWSLSLRAPWPVDRVYISEARRLGNPLVLPVADALVRAFQKNPYEAAVEVLKRTKGGDSNAVEFLKQIWKPSDIELMKTEMTRLGKMKLRSAQQIYLKREGALPTKVGDLVQKGLLPQVPFDYFSGRPLDLTSL